MLLDRNRPKNTAIAENRVNYGEEYEKYDRESYPQDKLKKKKYLK